MLVLPFEASIPAGVKAYTVEYTDPKITGKIIVSGKIPANTPVLVSGAGTFAFVGSGTIAASANLRSGANSELAGSAARNMQVGITGAVYIGIPAPIGGYYLDNTNGTPVFNRVTAASQPTIHSFDAYLAPGLSTTAQTLELLLDETALPVRLGSFTATPSEAAVRLDWTTHNEKGNAGFDIERSADARRFVKIATIKGFGDSETDNHYQWIDQSPLPAMSYYRLRQNDLDGTFAYSVIRAVNNSGFPAITVYPNPVSTLLTLDLKKNKVDGELVITNALGQNVIRSNSAKGGTIRIDVSGLSAGIYFYRLDNLTGSFVKN